MIWLICTILAYGFELIGMVVMLMTMIGMVSPEARHSKIIGTMYKTLYFDDEFEDDKALI